ncbi:MAG: hypothetical protein ACLPX5_01525 [Dissulfurispiraceae bacterium]
MKYSVIEPFTVKAGKSFKVGVVIALPKDKAAVLIESRKIIPLRTLFDNLFHAHAERMRACSLTADEIKLRDQKSYTAIQAAINEMDNAWFGEDLPAFKDAMGRAERIYFEVKKRLWTDEPD